MKQKEMKIMAWRNIAFAALDGFERNHQGAQGIMDETILDKLATKEEHEQFIDMTLAMIRKLGCNDDKRLLEIRKDELEEVARTFEE